MYQVDWLESALNDLANYWLKADSAMRQAITSAANQIDQRLTNDPVGESESRPGNRRILFDPPLGIQFRLEADGQTVTVVDVWAFKKRTK